MGRWVTPPGGVSLSSAIEAYEKNLRATLDPSQSGLAVIAVRADSEAASQGAVNFGEYFLYFSFFLVVSAVLLTGLFFKLGVEQRLREIGLLRAIGFDTARLASIFLVEGFGLAVLGTAAGLLGALAYAALMTLGLRTWWIGAVGTRLLRLHVSAASLILGSTAGILTAQLCILWTLRGLRRFTSRALLHGESGLQVASAPRARRGLLMAGAFTAFGLLTLLAAALGRIPQVAAFFSIGVLMLSTLLCIQWVWLARGGVSLEARSGLSALSRLGFRNATWRPGRSLLCISLMASATFIIVAVDSFRRTGPTTLADRKSGTGGYELLAESLLPVAYDLNSTSAQQSLNFSAGAIAALRNVRIDPFRVRPGDDASCLNLYLPRNPRILGVPSSFIQQGRFAFQQSLARTREEKSNPWLLLDANPGDGAIPAIADANSLTYNLHLKVGEEFVFNAGAARPIRLRIVAALSDSLFQRELLISEQNFLSLFAADPAAAGFHFFLLDLSSAAGGSSRAAQVSSALESSLSDFGFDASSAADRLAAFHRVENTYLSTFQALGGLGLLLGTFGLAAVLLRNILERRRELALLRAVGYRPADLAWLVVAENAWLLFAGLGTGVASALVAVTPVLLERGSRLPALSLAALLSEVLVVGLLASLVAVAAVVRMPLLPVLRAE